MVNRINLEDQKDGKNRVIITARRTARGDGYETEQFSPPCPNLATEDTYGDGGEDDVRGRREDGVGEVAAAKRFVTGIIES